MQSILIIRLSAIGDIVMASALIAPLRQKYPNSRIYWLAQPECKTLLEQHPDISEVFTWDKQSWQKLWRNRQYQTLWRALQQLRQQLKAQQFDLVLDLQGLLKSGLLAWFSGAKKRVGLGSKEGSQYLMHHVLPRDQGDRDWIGSEYRYLAQHLRLQYSPWQMQIGLDEAARQAAHKLIERHGLEQGFIVFCPFTTRPQKHWFNDSWCELAEKCHQAWQLPIALLGGPADQAAAENISQTVSKQPTETGKTITLINLAGQTSLLGAAALIKRSQLLIGVDTGLTHMGHMHGIPTVALFGSTRPYLKTDNPYSRVIYHALDCSPCKRSPTCDGRFDCMHAIKPGGVIETARPLVNAFQRSQQISPASN